MTNNFTSEIIDSLAKKVMINLSDEENKAVLDEFEFIDANMNLITKIEGIEKVEPMIHPFNLYECNLREDEDEDSDSIEDLLSNCDKTEGREVEVPKVVG